MLWVVQRAGDLLTSGLKTCWRHPGLPLPPEDPSSPRQLVYLNHNTSAAKHPSLGSYWIQDTISGTLQTHQGTPILQIGKPCLKEASHLSLDNQLGGGGAGILVYVCLALKPGPPAEPHASLSPHRAATPPSPPPPKKMGGIRWKLSSCHHHHMGGSSVLGQRGPDVYSGPKEVLFARVLMSPSPHVQNPKALASSTPQPTL